MSAVRANRHHGEWNDVRFRAVALGLALVIPAQCAAPPGKDAGGDNNPQTGECTIAFAESVGGKDYRYPFLADKPLRLIAGKVIFVCSHPPTSHQATAFLETRRSGSGQQWREVYQDSMTRVPNPKDSIFLRGTCDPRTVGYWRVRVNVSGEGVDRGGKRVAFAREDLSPEVRIECP